MENPFSRRVFRDRTDAGESLADRVVGTLDWKEPLVLGLPRGGVPVAFGVARRLRAALDVFVVRKLGVPGQEELAMGAIASGGQQVLNGDIVSSLRITNAVLEETAERERRELERRERLYRGDRPFPAIRDRDVILIDDGIATGATMRAGLAALRAGQARRIAVGTPVVAASTVPVLRSEADELVTVLEPASFFGVGAWYADFTQTSDQEVIHLLEAARGGWAVDGGKLKEEG